MASDKKNGVSDVGAWAMNVISSVGIIMANKQVMSGYNFRFGEILDAKKKYLYMVVDLTF